MTNPLTPTQISTATYYLATDHKKEFFQVNSPIRAMGELLTGLANHPTLFDDASAPDTHYAALKHHASNSRERSEDALKGIASLLEAIGCAGDGLDCTQVTHVSCLLAMVVDTMQTSRELHDAAARVLAVRKIARLQVDIANGKAAPGMKNTTDEPA